MTRKIKTAEEHQADITKLQRKLKREKTAEEKLRAQREFIGNIRDDVVSMLKNSGVSDEDIHANLGPHPSTLKAWREDKVRSPQMGKMQSALYVIGKRFAIVDR